MPTSETTHYKEAGRYIRSRREELRLTQADVVEQMKHLGITTSVSAIHRLEAGNGKQNFGDVEFLNALARILRVNIEDILAVMGFFQAHQFRLDTRTQRILETVSKLSPSALETVEQILDALVLKQEQEERR